jgi:filamentous hemagglutinin family protein
MRKSVLRRDSVQQTTNSALSHRIKPTAVALAVATCFSANFALANPTGGTVVHGAVVGGSNIPTPGNILNIQTLTPQTIINWGSFSINVGELTRFIQPSALSAVLNRVIGQDPSAILGALQSNGRVFLLNPNGIVFGAGSQINVAGLVASTLKMSNDDFLNNRMKFTDGAGAGSVVNNGNITGGSVYLVGNAVTNNGLITSPGGEVVLAAGNSVELVNPGTPNLRVEIVAPDNEARNLGTITAEAGRIGIYAGLINNSGTLNASSAVSEGGKILLKAKKDITLTSTSVLDASGKGGGEIVAFADNNTYVDGTLNASAPTSGNGGFIETSGKNRVKIADTAFVTTAAAQGKTGTWLIDPNSFVIAASGGDTTGGAISGQLANNNLVITSNEGSGQYGGTNGDILVNDSIEWYNSNSLTLTAIGNVEVNASITNAYGGGINLYAGWDGVSAPVAPTISNYGSILLNAPISSSLGEVRLIAGGNVGVSGESAPIDADRLLAVSNFGSVYLNGAPNAINTIAGKAVQNFMFRNNKSLTVGTVGGVAGIEVNNPSGNATVQIDVNGFVSGADLTVNNNITAFSSAGSATINLYNQDSYGGNIHIANSVVSAIGADGAEGGANVNLFAKGTINTASSTVSAFGGYYGGYSYLSAYGGDITLGLVTGSHGVNVSSPNGAIVDGNTGLNISAPEAYLYGANGVGSVANPLETQVSYLDVSSAYGGIGVINAGNLVLGAFGANGNSAIGATGNLTVDGGEGSSSVNGDLALLANGDLNILRSVSATGNLVLNSLGNTTIGGPDAYYSGVSVWGDMSTTAIAGGNLSVLRTPYYSSELGSSGLMTVKTGGNVLVDQSGIYGSPDVIMNVGGVVNINGSAAYGGYAGSISAGSSDTIHLTFTNLTSGGFSVNGIEGLVFDPATNTGFFANGSQAVLGDSLLVTYGGGGGATLNIPTDTLIVAMGESSKPPDPEKDKNVFEDVEEGKKKDAPVCR